MFITRRARRDAELGRAFRGLVAQMVADARPEVRRLGMLAGASMRATDRLVDAGWRESPRETCEAVAEAIQGEGLDVREVHAAVGLVVGAIESGVRPGRGAWPLLS